MLNRSARTIILLAAAICLIDARELLAWGPATHVKLAFDLLAELGSLSGVITVVLGRHARDFVYGNVAADIVFAKRMSRVRQFCHQWATPFQLFHEAKDDSTRAFALGYLSHLAADTVAHNKYLPRQMTVTRSTMSFGHLYWELRADSSIGTHYWLQLRRLMAMRFPQHDELLERRLTETLLPFEMNRVLFRRINYICSRRPWVRTMERWQQHSRWHLDDQLLRDYRTESLDRMHSLLAHLERSPVLNEDPNGNSALRYTRAARRQLRRMARAGLLEPHVVHEVITPHAPVPRPGDGEPTNGKPMTLVREPQVVHA